MIKTCMTHIFDDVEAIFQMKKAVFKRYVSFSQKKLRIGIKISLLKW